MVAKPKMSPEEWAAVRVKWEADPRKGFPWIIAEMGLPVSGEALRQRSKNEGWSKLGSDGAAKSKLAGGNPKLGKRPIEGRTAAPTIEPMADAATGCEIVEKVGGGELLPARKPTPFLDALDPRERIFVLEYAIDGNGTRSAIAAGYSERSAHNQAGRLVKRDEIKQALHEVMAERCEAVGWDVERVLRHWADLAEADPLKLTQHRIRACRHCWGIEHAYQCTPAEYQERRIKHIERRANLIERTKEDIGEFTSHEGDWYDGRRDPNPDCPECHGIGVAYTWMADTRKLTGKERALYGGTKRTKDGVEVLQKDQQKAVENIARALGIGREDSGDVNINVTDASELGKQFAERMRLARERQAEVLRERGLVDDDEEGEK